MRVIVVGCGRVGSELAVRLQQAGHSVSIIDKNSNAFRRLPEGWGGRTVVGFGFDRDVLLQAGIQEANAVAAVTSGDNSNILTARIARETFEISHVVARIKSPRRAVIYQRLGIPTVATVSWTVDQVARRLLPEEGVTVWTDPRLSEVNMVEHLLPESFCGHSYGELTDGEQFRPILVTRGGQSRLVGPAMVGQEGDLVHICGSLRRGGGPGPQARRGGPARRGGRGRSRSGPHRDRDRDCDRKAERKAISAEAASAALASRVPRGRRGLAGGDARGGRPVVVNVAIAGGGVVGRSPPVIWLETSHQVLIIESVDPAVVAREEADEAVPNCRWYTGDACRVHALFHDAGRHGNVTAWW